MASRFGGGDLNVLQCLRLKRVQKCYGLLFVFRRLYERFYRATRAKRPYQYRLPKQDGSGPGDRLDCGNNPWPVVAYRYVGEQIEGAEK